MVMKKAEAIIKPFKLDEVKDALSTLGKTACKNPYCHSERSEESHIFLFKSKNQKRDPSAFGLRMTRKGKLTKILEHPYPWKLWYYNHRS
jgi:hypothetical protein